MQYSLQRMCGGVSLVHVALTKVKLSLCVRGFMILFLFSGPFPVKKLLFHTIGISDRTLLIVYKHNVSHVHIHINKPCLNGMKIIILLPPSSSTL